jgi:hypothetical protein
VVPVIFAIAAAVICVSTMSFVVIPLKIYNEETETPERWVTGADVARVSASSVLDVNINENGDCRGRG